MGYLYQKSAKSYGISRTILQVRRPEQSPRSRGDRAAAGTFETDSKGKIPVPTFLRDAVFVVASRKAKNRFPLFCAMLKAHCPDIAPA
jgi:hypothetical protein